MRVGRPHQWRTVSSAACAGAPSRRCVDTAGVKVYTSVPTGVDARARPGSPVPIGAEPFRQGREHGHGRFWPLLQYGV